MKKEEQHIHDLLKNISIFWINLERSERRRNIMLEEFKKYNLIHTRIEAVDGNDIDVDEYKKKYTIDEKMNKYEIACALSHMKVIKHCYDQGLEYALILEDDANFDYFPYKTDTLLELLEELKIIDGECLQLANIIPRKQFPIYKNKFENKKMFKTSSAAGTQSYLITRNGMKKVLDNFENIKKLEVADIYIYNITNNFITTPFFSYPFLKKDKGEILDGSTIRDNTKSAHATQTYSKMLWDEYYQQNNQ